MNAQTAVIEARPGPQTTAVITEEWRPVVNFEGCYEVSSQGRIRNMRTGHVLIGGESGKGYRTVSLRAPSRKERKYIHHVVLEAFVGPRPSGLEAAHCNGVRDDNRLINLRWDTRSGNFADKKIHGTEKLGERHPMAKLTDEQVRVMRDLHKLGISPKASMKYFGISRMNHWRIVNRKMWRHIA